MLGPRATIVLGAVAAFVITYALIGPSIRIAKRLGAIDEPGGRRVHEKATTRMGGIALFFGIVVPLTAVYALVKFGLASEQVRPANSIFLPGVFLGMLVMFITGCIDDVRQLRIRWKLVGQIVACVIVAASGVITPGLKAYDGQMLLDFGIMAWPITVFWLVAFANVVNLVDGLDGLAAGVCAISVASLLVLGVIIGNWATALFAAVMFTACVAFLRFNFYPAKLFMGDSGSLTLGLTLGIISLLGVMKVSTLTSFIVPVIIAGIPIIDTAAAIVRRRAKHEPIGNADKEHIHHSLLKLGFDQRRVVLTIYALCIVFAVSGIVIVQNGMVVRLAVILVDALVAVFLVWHLQLFGGVLVHFYGRNERRGVKRPSVANARKAQPHLAKAADGAPAADAGARPGEGNAHGGVPAGVADEDPTPDARRG